jgi:hypothetical protein
MTSNTSLSRPESRNLPAVGCGRLAPNHTSLVLIVYLQVNNLGTYWLEVLKVSKPHAFTYMYGDTGGSKLRWLAQTTLPGP